MAYVRFVLCQAESGYSYYPKSLFDRGFANLKRELQNGAARVKVRNLMDGPAALLSRRRPSESEHPRIWRGLLSRGADTGGV